MSPELVSDIARVAHEKLLSILTECGIEKTAGTCLFASYLVCYLAKTKGLDAVVRGCNGEDDGGIFIECGGFGHYWCELNFEEVQYYIDITSEQFGFHPYIVKLANDITGWPRYIPGDQETVDSHLEQLLRDGYTE